MIKNYLLITLRNLMKNKIFILINVFGMGIAIACCVVAYVNWEYSRGWDSTQKNAQDIYMIQFARETDQHRIEQFALSPTPLATVVKQNFKEVSSVVRLDRVWCDMRIGEEMFVGNMAYVDSSFFKMFTFELKYGTWNDFYDRSKVFISDKVAKQYYNSEDAVGKPLTQMILGKDGVRRPKEFIVGGVFKKLPSNSSFDFGLYTLYDNYWEINNDPNMAENNWKGFNLAFLQIPDPANVAGVTRQLQNYVEPQNKVREDFKVSSYYLQPFKGMAIANRQQQVRGGNLNGGVPEEAVTVPAIMAGMLLLIACFNFTNTSISISSQRLKEIGIRKVMGGMRSELILQFLGENLILCMLGLFMGLLMAEWLVPAYDEMWQFLELSLVYKENIGFLIFLTVLLIITALIAGGYPSFYVTSFEPVSILKGKSKFGGTNVFTKVLLGGQFLISLLAIVMAVAFYNNGKYQRDYDLGFATHGVISAYVTNEAGFNTYRDALAENTDIKMIAGTVHHVANSWYKRPVKYNEIKKDIDMMDLGDGYLDVMDMTVLSGRKFIKDSETDRKESVLVSEDLVKQFGWTDNPVGKRLVMQDTVQLYVIGVIKDVYSRALWRPVEPLIVRYAAPKDYLRIVVKTDPSKIASVNAFMEKKWKGVFQNTLYDGQMIDQELQETNEINDNVVVMFGFLGFFAALMTGIGMYTLVSLNIVKKMKEIGVRKVLGASIADIARVINYQFVIILVIATVAGAPLGYFGSDWLMHTIWTYYETLTLTSALFAVLALVVVAVLSVGYKTITTASLNPTKTLRDE